MYILCCIRNVLNVYHYIEYLIRYGREIENEAEDGCNPKSIIHFQLNLDTH